MAITADREGKQKIAKCCKERNKERNKSMGWTFQRNWIENQ